MKFRMKISTAWELSTVCNAIVLISKTFSMKRGRITTHRYHAEKVRLLRVFEALPEEERIEILCATFVLRDALAGICNAKAEVEVEDHDEASQEIDMF